MKKYLLCFLLTGCSHISIDHTLPNGGQVSFSGWEFGTKTALEGLTVKANKGYLDELGIGNANSDVSPETARIMQLMIEGAFKGAAMAAGKP